MKNVFKSRWTKALALGVTLLLAAGCGGGSQKADAPKQEAGKIVQVAGVPTEKLIPEAKKEGKVVVYSITARISKAAKKFEEKYGIQVEASNLKDFELIDKISTEAKAKAVGADFVICQDSGRVWGELLQTGYLQNYVPAAFSEKIPKAYQNPLVFVFMNKVLVYNTETFPNGAPIKNIWELTEPKWKGKFFFKSPMQEGINADFLTMLTAPENAEKMAKAYESLYKKKLELTTPNAGYEWIKMIFSNGVVMGSSDTSMTEAIGVRGQNTQGVGLLNYSKLRYAKTKNLAIAPIEQLEPLTGFYYPEYALLVKDAKHPNAAKLFIEFLLTQEGLAPWQNDIGTYSSNPDLKPAKGDKPLSEWAKVTITDDPQYIFEHRAEVEEFISKYL